MSDAPDPPSGPDSPALSPESAALERALPGLVAELRPEYEAIVAQFGATDAGAGFALDLANVLVSRVVQRLHEVFASEEERQAYAQRLLLGLVTDPGAALALPEEADERIALEIPEEAHRAVLLESIARIAEQAIGRVLLGQGRPDQHSRPDPEARGGMFARGVAQILDFGLLIGANLLMLALLSHFWEPMANLDTDALGYLMLASGALVNSLLIATTGTTLGKRAMGLEVVRAADGKRPSVWAALLREYVGRVANQFLAGIGVWTAFRDPRHRTWGDQVGGTMVIRASFPVFQRRILAVAGAVMVCIVFFVLPQFAAMGQTSAQLDEFFDEEPSLISLVDSMIVLGTRTTLTAEDYTADMLAIRELAPEVKSRVFNGRILSERYVEQARAGVPWRVPFAVRLDSMVMLYGSCADAANRYAEASLGQQWFNDKQSAGAKQQGLIADYNLADLSSDRHYLATLAQRLVGASEDPDE